LWTDPRRPDQAALAQAAEALGTATRARQVLTVVASSSSDVARRRPRPRRERPHRRDRGLARSPGRAVFMGFWISHVPAERFVPFWSLVADCLTPDGRMFFCDDAYRTEDELIEGPGSSTIRRHVPDGTDYRLVKVPHRPSGLESQLRRLGWDITVHPTAGPFYWGAGQRAAANRSNPRSHRP
jgi:demethylmenaquinone methyltransferase/2-methoxy-6-polyprenyl-1,4-benzoquinol methylase